MHIHYIYQFDFCFINFLVTVKAPTLCPYSNGNFSCLTETAGGFLLWEDAFGFSVPYSAPNNIDASPSPLDNGFFSVRLSVVDGGGRNFNSTATVKNVTFPDDVGRYITCSDGTTKKNVTVKINDGKLVQYYFKSSCLLFSFMYICNTQTFVCVSIFLNILYP